MKTARELKEGQTLLIGEELYKVASLTHHSGSAQLSGMIKATLRNVKTGRVIEKRWSLDEDIKDIKEVDLDRVEMQFLYADDNGAVFMHPQTYEQFALARPTLEHLLPFMKEGETLPVEFYEGEPISLDMPKMVPLCVTSCGQGIKGQRDIPLKEATLENGMAVMVPHFIQEGDTVLIEVKTGKYVDRLRKA